jgi:hypothetical protein
LRDYGVWAAARRAVAVAHIALVVLRRTIRHTAAIHARYSKQIQGTHVDYAAALVTQTKQRKTGSLESLPSHTPHASNCDVPSATPAQSILTTTTTTIVLAQRCCSVKHALGCQRRPAWRATNRRLENEKSIVCDARATHATTRAIVAQHAPHTHTHI